MDINISTDKNHISKWETFNLKIEIEWDLSSNLKIWEIKWLENFEVLGKSQSQSSASKTVIINWQTQNDSKTIYSIFYNLKWINQWNFTIWPISINDSENSIITNPINIKVTSDWILSKITQKNQTEINQNNLLEPNLPKYKTNKINWLEILKNIFLLFILIILLLWLFLYFKNKEKLDLFIKNLKEKNKTKTNNENNDRIKGNNIIENNDIIKDKNIQNKAKLEEKKKIYPNLEDNDFIPKLESIFLLKLKEKYKIEWIKNKTYVDILWELENISYYEKEKIKMLGNLFNKAKYSKIWVDKKELLWLIK